LAGQAVHFLSEEGSCAFVYRRGQIVSQLPRFYFRVISHLLSSCPVVGGLLSCSPVVLLSYGRMVLLSLWYQTIS
jgi:hypothetical protein